MKKSIIITLFLFVPVFSFGQSSENQSIPSDSAKVYVSFIVNKAGDISQVKIVRGVDPSLDDEVKRTINSAPAWTPGKQRGKEVNVQMAIPVKFQLQ